MSANAVTVVIEDDGEESHGSSPHYEVSAGDVDFMDELIGEDEGFVAHSGSNVISKTFRAEEDEKMRTFMKQKTSILSDIKTIEEKSMEVTALARQLEDVYVEDEAKKIQAKILASFQAGDARTLRVKKKLNQLKKSSNELKKSNNPRIKSQLQIRKSIQKTLEKRFIEVSRDLQTAKGSYRSRLRENITRQVKIADPQATEDEIEEAIESGTAHDLIQRSLNKSSLGHQAFQDKADDIAEKSKDIKELEKSMLKLKAMFEDLAQLIEMQSEQIDVIEVSVEAAASNVKAGNQELEGVVTEQTAIRKRITIFLVIIGVCVIGGVIAAIVLLT